jgi:hypothetical protein
LALMMNAPVWYLSAKLSEAMGGSGWHRAYLIDQWVAHFGEWWLFGTTYTAHWGPAGETIPGDPNMMDITNHFVMEAVKGGLLKLLLFVAMLVGCFKVIGRRLHLKRRQRVPDSSLGPWAWLCLRTACPSCRSPISTKASSSGIGSWQSYPVSVASSWPNRLPVLKQQLPRQPFPSQRRPALFPAIGPRPASEFPWLCLISGRYRAAW